jgi:hypothetical protein
VALLGQITQRCSKYRPGVGATLAPGLVAAVGEADLEQLFELEDRAVARLLQPGGERPRPLAVIV